MGAKSSLKLTSGDRGYRGFSAKYLCRLSLDWCTANIVLKQVRGTCQGCKFSYFSLISDFFISTPQKIVCLNSSLEHIS